MIKMIPGHNDPDETNREAVALQGQGLLGLVEDELRRFCVLPNEALYPAVALWVAVSHCLPAFDVAPRLVIRSIEKRSGKTRLMEILRHLVHRPLSSSNITEAALFRSLAGKHPPTVLIDEADTVFGAKAGDSKEGLRGIINAGFQRGASAHRVGGQPDYVVQEYPVFAMAAIAGIGPMPDTIEDRAIVLAMKRRKEVEEPVGEFRVSRDRAGLLELGKLLTKWAVNAIPLLMDADPEMPVTDRAADTWYPLIAVADLVGGDIGKVARSHCRMLTDRQNENDPQSAKVTLLRDICAIFEKSGVLFIASQELCAALVNLPESPWKDWDLSPNKLGYRLKEFGVRPVQDASRSRRGYKKADFRDAFERYLPPENKLREKESNSESGQPGTVQDTRPQRGSDDE